MTFESIIPLLKPIASEVTKKLLSWAKSNNKILRINEKNIEESLELHINKVNTFTSEISFKELNKPKSLFSVYIPLDLSLNRIENDEINDSLATQTLETKIASEIIEQVFGHSNNNVILIGVPGSGKTTTLKFLCQKLFTDESFLTSKVSFPILIRFREDEILNNRSIPLFEYVLNVFGIVVENTFKCSDPIDDKNQLDIFKKQAALKILNLYNPLLVLDGIDEVSDDIIKDKLIRNINEVSLSAKNTKFILTTRKGDDRFHIENTQLFELAPLNDNQIRIFTEKWLGDNKANEFLNQLKASSVFDTAKRPLTLSHLCAIFEKEGRIPEKSRSIYRKIVNLLILEWNVESNINRASRFNSFEPDRKKEFLENLAFELSVSFNKNQFSTSDLEKCYGNLYLKFGFTYMQMRDVLNEIQVHNGLITQTGYDRFEFAHKSFQEYLAAEHIVKLPKIPVNSNLIRVPSEMALAVTLSSEPSDYLACFIDEYLLLNECDFGFLKSFVIRLCIEKPDFLESHSLAKSLLFLQSKYFTQLLNKEKKIIISDVDLKILDDSFSLLGSFETIKSSLDYFRHDYTAYLDTKGIDYFEITYHKDFLDKSLFSKLCISENFFNQFIKNILYQSTIRNRN